MIILNTLISVLSMFFYSLVIIGYGAKFKSLFFANSKNSIGEFGNFGFIFFDFSINNVSVVGCNDGSSSQSSGSRSEICCKLPILSSWQTG